MDIQNMIYNRKGFVHHPDTPQEDKVFYEQQKEKAQHLWKIGTDFVNRGGILEYRSMPIIKEELGTQSKFLHRGVYCPSPVLDLLITNSKRGRILVRPSAQSRITNRYMYDTSGKLIFTENFIDERPMGSEYLLYQDQVVYGITVKEDGRLSWISEEQYVNGRLVSYDHAYYQHLRNSVYCFKMDCERYAYDALGLLDWDYYVLDYGAAMVAPSGFVDHRRYQFSRKDGWLISFTPINLDGTHIAGGQEIPIKLKRKA